MTEHPLPRPTERDLDGGTSIARRVLRNRFTDAATRIIGTGLPRVGALAASAVAAAAVSGCAPGQVGSTPSSSIQEHATAAGIVMTRTMGPLPARAAALLVVGTGSDDTIDALSASGTTWGGSVELRITVTMATDQHGIFGSTRTKTECFRYHFSYPRQTDWQLPMATDCGHAVALDLNNPPLPSGITSDTGRKVLAAVDGLTVVQRFDTATVTAALRGVLGPDYTITGNLDGHGVSAWIRYGDACMSLSTSQAKVQIGPPRSGIDCFGG